MSSAIKIKAVAQPPDLYNGDRLTQPEFHRLYSQYADDVKFELIGGMVHMASPLRRPHSKYHVALSVALELYESQTPGTDLLDNATIILGQDSEPQPDLTLRILTENGGQSRVNTEGYIEGAPELVAEIAHSTRAIDMHAKRIDYERAGVREYAVLSVEEPALHWFDFKARRPLKPDVHGVYRSRVFPGLWIDGPALLARERRRLMDTLRQGLASREHAAFIKRLDASRKRT